MRGILLAVGLLLVACDDDLCPNSYGYAYSCTCQRRCQGVTDTYNTSYACDTTGNSTSVATSSCEDTCSPEATCSCTCTQGMACELDPESCR